MTISPTCLNVFKEQLIERITKSVNVAKCNCHRIGSSNNHHPTIQIAELLNMKTEPMCESMNETIPNIRPGASQLLCGLLDSSE